MLVNELAQWAVIVFLAIVVFGLVRQLGTFIVPRQQQLLLRGPDVGSPFPVELLQDVPIAGWADAIRRSPDGLGLVAFVNDGCSGCHGLVDRLEARGVPGGVPVIAVADTVDGAFEERLRKIFDYTVVDLGLRKSRKAGITATPFVIAVDDKIRVRHRALAGGLHELLDEIRGLVKQAEPGVYPQARTGVDAATRDEVIHA